MSLTALLFSADGNAQLSTATPTTDTKAAEGRKIDHSNDPLDDASEQQLQQSLNQVYNQYNSQIAEVQSQVDLLKATGVQKCEADASQQIAEANQEASQAKAQAMASMMGPAAQALGQMLEGGHGAAGSEGEVQQKKLDNIIEQCELDGFDCSPSGDVSPTVEKKKECDAKAAEKPACLKNLNQEASFYEEKILNQSSRIKEVGAAGGGALSSIAQLAAAGMGGAMTAKAAKESAALQIASAEQQKELCAVQVESELNNLARQISQLEQARARDILMANMQAEYQTKLRRKTADGLEVDTSGLDTGDMASLDGDPGEGPQIPYVQTADGAVKGSQGVNSPAGGSAAPSSGGSGSAPAWAFGGGGSAFDGGSALPMQPKGAKYAGAALSSANTGKGGGMGGFGAIENKGALSVSADKSDDFQPIGDGGLRVLLARTAIVHARHSPELVKGIDFDKLAKTQAPKQNQNAAQNKERAPATVN